MKPFNYSAGRQYLAAKRAAKVAVPVKVVKKSVRKNSYPLTKIFRFKRTYSTQINLTTSGSPQTSALTVALTQFPGVSSDVQNLFDKYRLRKVTVKFIPMQRDSLSAGQTVGQIATIIDNDDANPPLDFNEMRQYPSYKTKSLVDYHTVTFKPYVSNALFNGSVFTGYGSAKDQWIDMASPAIPHYGLKVGIQNCNMPTGTLLFDVEVSAIIEFDKVR